MQNQGILPRRLPAVSGKILSGVLAVAIVASGVAIYRYKQASRTADVPYTTAKVQNGTITDTVTGTGPISASAAVPLNFKSSGKLATINVKVGDQVKAGQVLATMDT